MEDSQNHRWIAELDRITQTRDDRRSVISRWKNDERNYVICSHCFSHPIFFYPIFIFVPGYFFTDRSKITNRRGTVVFIRQSDTIFSVFFLFAWFQLRIDFNYNGIRSESCFTWIYRRHDSATEWREKLIKIIISWARSGQRGLSFTPLELFSFVFLP